MKIFFAEGKSVNRGRLRLRLNSHWESLGYFDLSDLENRFDLGISELQEGDKLVLNAAAESFVGSVLFRYPLMEVSDEALVVGVPLLGGITVASNHALAISSDPIASFLPLPFRQGSFKEVYLVGVTSREAVKEACRVIKPEGIATLILPDPRIGGPDPVEGLSLLSTRFNVTKVRFKDMFWIFEGKVRRLCGSER
jgi:hypothetical protein